ncbi:MAG: hypothetical protein KDJ52_04170 [Anaerolineae bacterium]|nr:hypothetical protein [Anaerolineae bacterium]
MAFPNQLQEWLQQGISAAKAGHVDQARFLLLDVVEQDQTNETAWYWLYQVFDRIDDKRVCLENLVIINPKNRWAKQKLLEHLEAFPSTGTPVYKGKTHRKKNVSQPKDNTAQTLPRPIPLKLVIAFWIGISFILFSGGIISAGEWLALLLGGQITLEDLTIIQYFDLLVTISFITMGLLGFSITVTLFLKSMIGFYGSILLGLAILLIGSTFSLILNPPNYSTMICTGGISGMIVLLTLASQSGFYSNPNNNE